MKKKCSGPRSAQREPATYKTKGSSRHQDAICYCLTGMQQTGPEHRAISARLHAHCQPQRIGSAIGTNVQSPKHAPDFCGRRSLPHSEGETSRQHRLEPRDLASNCSGQPLRPSHQAAGGSVMIDAHVDGDEAHRRAKLYAVRLYDTLPPDDVNPCTGGSGWLLDRRAVRESRRLIHCQRQRR